MILAIDTQYRENYGFHDWTGEGEVPQYWKSKGGSTYLVTGDVNHKNVINELTNLINYKNEASEEFVIAVHLEEDGYCSNFEKSQKEEPYGSIDGVHYDTRIVRREDGTYVATEQFKGPRGEYSKIWNMAPGGEKENYSYTEVLNKEANTYDY